MSNLSDIGEYQLIERLSSVKLAKPARIAKGIGDDCAVVKLDDGTIQLMTVDVMIDGVHFNRKWQTPHQLGRKLLAINLSDIASMGGEPREAVVTAMLPADLEVSWIEELFLGLEEMALEYGVNLVGGDTSQSPDRLAFSLTLTGVVPARTLYRSGAKDGDDLYMTGCAGDSAAGLKLLQSGDSGATYPQLLSRYLDPAPRVELGQLLAENGHVHAMTDISDSLTIDTHNLSQASGIDIFLCQNRIPLSDDFKRYAKDRDENLHDLALNGGGDYELLFSAAPNFRDDVAKISQQAGVPITLIGAVSNGGVQRWKVRHPQLFLENLPPSGFEHFRQ